LPVNDDLTAVILPLSEFNCDNDVSAAVQYYYCRPDISLSLVGGRKYEVLWDGSYYNCVCKEYSAEIDGQLITAYALGNEVFGHGDVDSGEPFLFYHIPGFLTEIDASSGGTHTTSIVENDVTPNKLPEEFLPDGLATEEYVDTAVESKNLISAPTNATIGDLLMYDGTNWTKISKADLIAEIIAALPSAEEASF
jgi:hypothetical protein